MLFSLSKAMPNNFKDKFSFVFDYLEHLSPPKAMLHIFTLLCLSLIIRFGLGDLDRVENRVAGEIERFTVMKKYAALKERVAYSYENLNNKWGAEFSTLIYYHDYYPMVGRFNALAKSYGFIVPTPDTQSGRATRAQQLLQDLPVLYDDQLTTMLNGQCYYQSDMSDFYLSDIASILDIEEFVSIPVTRGKGDMVAYISIAFTGDREFSPEQLTELCADLEAASILTSNTYEFAEIFGNIQQR